MSVSNTTSKAGPYSANGAQTVFPFGFKAFSKNDLRVVLTDVVAVESDLTVDSDFTVTLNPDQNASPGGSITTSATYAVGYLITVVSDLTPDQLVSLTNFRPDVIEKAFDKLTLLVQQLFEQTSRSVKTAVSSTTTADSLLTSIAASVSVASASATAASGSATAASNSAIASNASAIASASSAADAAASAASITPLATQTHAATSKAAPVDADEIPLVDSAAAFGIKKLTWANLKATVKTYFDSFYALKGSNSDITALTGLTGESTIKGVALFGYGTGAGGTVTQATSKTTTVTINKPTGQITMNAAALAAGATITFQVNNSLVGNADVVFISMTTAFSGTAYNFWTNVGGGLFFVTIKNISAGSLSDALILNFTVIKGATS